MPAPLALSIVIVNWNSTAYLRQCIASIQRGTGDVPYEIVVIDSASYDGCDGMLREHYPEVRFIQSGENLGFARANNRAAGECRGEYLLFLNPDTEVIGAAIDRMVSELARLPRAGVIGCRLLNADRTVQTTCIRSLPTILNRVADCEILRTAWPRSSLWGAAALYDPQAGPKEVAAVSGACMMVPKRVFLEVGGFSTEYFMYSEDIDLCDRVRKASYRNYYVPAASIVHHGGSSSERAGDAFAAVMRPEATVRFLRRTRGAVYATGFRAAMAMSAVVRLALLEVAALVPRGRGKRQPSIRKWRAVLMWAVKRDGIVQHYYHRPERSA